LPLDTQKTTSKTNEFLKDNFDNEDIFFLIVKKIVTKTVFKKQLFLKQRCVVLDDVIAEAILDILQKKRDNRINKDGNIVSYIIGCSNFHILRSTSVHANRRKFQAIDDKLTTDSKKNLGWI
jgi:hypothetical protein